MDLLPTIQTYFCQKILCHGCICGLAVLQHGFMEDNTAINHCGCYWGKTVVIEKHFLSAFKFLCERCLVRLQGSSIAMGKRKWYFSNRVAKNVMQIKCIACLGSNS